MYVIKYIIVNDCFVICVGSSLLSKTVDVTKLMRYIRYQVTCSVNAAVDYQLSIYLTLAIFDISAQKPFLLILVENGLEILGAG